MMIKNPRKPILGLLLEGDIGYYYRRNDTIPYVMDRRFVVGVDKVVIIKSPVSKDKHGLRSNQEFTQTWDGMPIVYNDGVGVNLKRMLMTEKGISDDLVNRIVTKYVDGNRRNLLSSNLILAEAVSFSTLRAADSRYEYYQFNSRLKNKKVIIRKEDLMKTFNEYCEHVSHPAVLSLDGILIAKKGC